MEPWENKSTMTVQTQIRSITHAESRLTHRLKFELERKAKSLFINKEFVGLVSDTISTLPIKDKVAALYFFKKLVIQLIRQPDQEHYYAFKDEYDEHLSIIADEQRHYEPVRWISAEIEYLINTSERLTTEDVNERVDIMAEAKKRLSKDFLTKVEVMELFRISKSTLNRRIAEGMPKHKKGKSLYFSLDEISVWIKKEEKEAA